MKVLFAVLTSRLLWGALGVTALSAVIWLIGPLLAIGDLHPLEAERYRLIAIAVVVLCWLYSQLGRRLYNAWLNRRLMDKLKTPAAPPSDSAAPVDSEEERVLAARFDEAARLLKKAHFNKAGRASWKHYFSSHYLYQLPWYAIIGAPGSGKTTALVNSGLQFPLADRFGKTALRGIGGTRNCDWWFTNEAVLLDTAGRYTTQESEQARDNREWLRFIALLRKYRRHQPLNGVIVTVSLTDLLTLSSQALQKQALTVRQRLLELHEQLGICFPVYVLVTKVDLLNGFQAWFADLDKTQRDQIWGFTFPWAETQTATFDLLTRFEQEFALLQHRLEAALPETLLREHDVKTRADGWLFPQEFAALRPLLSGWIGTVFARSDFEAEFTPRGIYLTSGTQEGLPFDRVMGELNRTFGLPAAQAHENWDSVSNAAPIPAGKGQSYFIHDLLQQVIFREAGLAGHNRWWLWRTRAAVWAGYALLTGALIVAGALWLTSYHKNRAYLQTVQARLPAVEQQSQQLQAEPQPAFLAQLPLLNSLLTLPDSEEFDLDHPPLSWRMGLYRGKEVRDAAQTRYYKALQQTLLPEVAQSITRWLRDDDGHDVDYSYEALKAYQMLYQPQHYDGKFLHAWVKLNLQRQLPADVTQAQRQQLDGHLTQLLDAQIQASPYAKDDALVARAQARISAQPLSQRVYGRLKRLLAHDDSMPPPVSLAALGGPQSELVFRRKSGRPINEGVPGLYTPAGYWNRFIPQIDGVTTALRRDDRWVLGAAAREEKAAQIEANVRQYYARDFIAIWDAFLADIQLIDAPDLTQRINLVRLLSGNNSPLRRLIVNLGQALKLARTEDAAAKASGLGNRAVQTLETLFGHQKPIPAQAADATQSPEQQVTAHYAPLLELAQSTDGGKTLPIDALLGQVDELYRYLVAVQGAANSGMPPPGGEVVSRLQASAGRLPGGLQTLFSTLAVGASRDSRQRELETMRRRVSVGPGAFCRQAIAGRYPLTRGARAEVTPGDLARMFAPGSGLMETFFRENLTGKVDTARAEWRFTPGVDGKTLPGSERLLRPFRQAQWIRDAFFASGGATPAYKVTLRTVRMDNTILTLTLDVDGQILRYSHGPQVAQIVNWPGPGGAGQVRMQLGLADGTTATLVTNGAWALNRFIDKATLSAGSSRLSRQATFSVDGHRVTLEVTPDSLHNPLFQLPHFSCP